MGAGTAPVGSDVVIQIGLVVKDAKAAGERWAKIFGLPAPEPHLTDGVEKTNAKFRGKPTEGRAKLAFIKMGQVSLELIEPVGGPSTWKEWLDAHGEGVHHIAFKVDDTERTEAALAKERIPVVQKGDFTGGRYSYVDTVPQLGVILELLQY